MAFGEDLFTRLSDDIGVGAIADNRIYPNMFKQQGVKPAIRYRRITSTQYHQMGTDANIQRQRYQIDCIAKTYSTVDGLADAVEVALSRWRSAGVVQDSYFISKSDFFDSDIKMHRIALDFDFIVEV